MAVDVLMTKVTSLLSNAATQNALIGILLICVGCIVFGGLMRLFFGKKSTLSKSISTVLGTLTIYLLVVVCFYHITALSDYLFPLPFVELSRDHLQILSISGMLRSDFSIGLLSLIILVFLFGLIDELIPEGKKLLSWFAFRLITILFSMLAYWVVNWLFASFLPNAMTSNAPAILIVLLAVFLAVTVFKWFVGIVLGVSVGPVIGGVYTFFISNMIGRQLTKAALASGAIVYLAHLADQYHLNLFTMDEAALTILLPVFIVLMLVRYLLGKVF